MRKDSYTRKLLYTAKTYFTKPFVKYVVFDLSKTPLPLYDDRDDVVQQKNVQDFLRKVEQADGFILSSPEYHGSMSGALKNALDWFEQLPSHALAGKPVGLMGGGGSFSNMGAVTQLLMTVRSLHGWVMPDVVMSIPKIWDAFEKENLREKMYQERLTQFSEKLIRYTKLFKEHKQVFI